MKIKTITCHDVYNTGASLQAYALQTYLEGLDHEVEIINYKPDYLSQHYSFSFVPNKKYDRPFLRMIYLVLKFPSRLKARIGKRKKRFDQFRMNYLHLTKRYESFAELKKADLRADVFFAGSDQIWNTFFRNGKDPAFYLQFVSDNSVRASYAASFATEDIEEEWKTLIFKWLSELDFISLRETSGVQIVEKMGIRGAVPVLDPVFLLSAEQWEYVCKKISAKDPYVLVYDFDQNEQIENLAKVLSKRFGLKIYTLQKLLYGDKSFQNVGPREFIGLIKNADYILSNSFHATAFSIIFKKQFWVFSRQESINTRMRDLTLQLGIENHFIVKYTDIDIDNIIDYNDVSIQLNRAIMNSKLYINKVLAEASNND